MEPSLALEVQGNGEAPKLTKRNGKNLGHVYSRQPKQVYVRRSFVGLTLKETNSGTIANVEVVVAKGVADASLVLLAPTSSSPSVEEGAWVDPARVEANVASQLYMGTPMLPVRDACVSLIARNELVRSVYPSSSTYALSSPSVASTHTPSTSYSWLNDMID